MIKAHPHTRIIAGSFVLVACACTGQVNQSNTDSQDTKPSASSSTNAGGGNPESFSVEVWADNWFSMWIGNQLIIEDSVPLTTERSFNAEVFSFEATRPFVMSFVLADFKENDSGLEYIGQPNQQMGDGGFIAQLRSMPGAQLVAVSNASWRCLVIHQAPLNKDCEDSPNPDQDCQFKSVDEPEGWKTADFDDSAWSAATLHSAADVGPKQGYDEISWDPSAALIWGPDLESDNTILCRAWVE